MSSTPVVEIPHYIDSNIQMIWWEVDEVAPFLTCLGAGIVLEMGSMMMLVGAVCSYFYMRHKRVSLDGTLEHMAYWIGLWPLNKKFTQGMDREFVE